ncbi:MAG: hypothetical protein MUC92_07995 [Fimbriimonadaceae bacterium]|jgi:type II secretory pathway pseudopilin PulG|nr:hypothetical protein [Fimbriimonadaceae bacterium]
MKAKIWRTTGALTLVELLIVIAIVVILTSIVFAVSRAAITQAQLTSCANNLRQVGNASFLYIADHNDQLPPFITDNTVFEIRKGEFVAGKAEKASWKKALLPYAGSNEVFYCPQDTARTTGAQLNSPGGPTTTTETSYLVLVTSQYYFWNGTTVQSKPFSTIEPKFPFMGEVVFRRESDPSRFYSFHGDWVNSLTHDGSLNKANIAD